MAGDMDDTMDVMLHLLRNARHTLAARGQRLILLPNAVADQGASILKGLANEMFLRTTTKRHTKAQQARIRDHMDMCAWLAIILGGTELDAARSAYEVLDAWWLAIEQPDTAPPIIITHPRLNRIKYALLSQGGPDVVPACELVDRWRNEMGGRKPLHIHAADLQLIMSVLPRPNLVEPACVGGKH